MGGLAEYTHGESFDPKKALEYKAKAMEELKGKVTFPLKVVMPYNTGNVDIVNRSQVVEQQMEKLLGTDYIDLYFLHRDDPARPVGEILECLEALCRAGSLRWYGCSNWKLPRIIEAREYALEHGLSGFVCNQLMWSLAVPDPRRIADKTLVGMDAETYAFHRQTGMAAMPYMSIAGGYFAHLAKGDLREEARLRYDLPINADNYKKLSALSAECGVTPGDLSLLYFASSPFPAVALASFSRTEQLEQCLALLENRPDVPFDLQRLRPDLYP